MSEEAEKEPALSLAGDFEAPTRQQWDAEVLKVLNRGRPEDKLFTVEQAYKKLTTTTVDGLTIKPIYVKEDFAEELGYPGVWPYTRGTVVRNGDMDAWQIVALHEDPKVSTTRKAVLTDLERGATAIWFRVDPDAIKAKDLPEMTADMLLELAPVMVSSRTDQDLAANALLELFEKSGKPADHLQGNLGIDPIGFAALNGVEPDLSQMGDWFEKTKKYRQVFPFVVDATVYNSAGAGDVQELAYAIATGLEYVRYLVDAGIKLDDAFRSILFRVSATTDQFLTICRLRALRTLWARVGEVLGVAPENCGAIQHAVTSFREMTRDDPYVNVLRGTIACFAAAVGGAEYQTVLPLDTVVGLPTEASRRIARNTQVVLSEESNIGRVNDPAGGSWYVESLTKELELTAWKLFTEIDTEGMIANLSSGVIASQLKETVSARNVLLAKRKIPITGVSMFPQVNEQPITAITRPEASSYAGLAPIRDAEVFEHLRNRANAADPRPKVLLACIGTRRDFGAREGFASPIFAVSAIETQLAEGITAEDAEERLAESKAKIAVLCSSGKVYAEKAIEIAKSLKDAGALKVYLAGNIKETASDEADKYIDGTIFLGMDVVKFLNEILVELGVK